MDIFFKTMKTPGKMACEKCLSVAAHALADRTWKDVKNYVCNMNVSFFKLKKGKNEGENLEEKLKQKSDNCT